MRLSKLFMTKQPVSVILGGYINGLGLVRSFGEKQIPSLVVDYIKSVAMYSKYSSGIICPHPVENEEQFIEFLLSLGEKLKSKGVLFATNDIWLIPISKNKKLLEKYYYYPMSEWSVINKCINKALLYEIAEKRGIPIPKTQRLNSVLELERIKHSVTFPCIIKPSITIGFLENLKSNGRTLTITNLEELEIWIKRIINSGLDNVPLILQEKIPGDSKNLYTLTSYSNREGDIIAYSTGHKIRQYPPDAGTILSGRVIENNVVYNLGKNLIKTLNFYGISNTEFKYDKKDNTYKLIEINPRPGMWNYSACAAGVNMPYLAYKEVLGESSRFIGSTNKELIWICLKSDFYYSLVGYKKKGYPDHTISFIQWLKSIKGKKVYAILSIRDVRPFLYYEIPSMINSFWRRLYKVLLWKKQ